MSTLLAEPTERFLADVPADQWHAPADVLDLPAAKVPRHIAVIMDGNGRWATRQGKPRHEGHAEGAAVVPDLVGECCRLRDRVAGPDFLTLYSFSLENWKRPADEVAFLMEMYVAFLREQRPRMMRENVRFNQIGRLDGLPQIVLDEVHRTLDETAKNDGLVVTLALNYGGRAELVDAARKLADEVAAGRMESADIDEATLESFLTTGRRGGFTGIELPDVDLLIRTAGELRVSNYLLWQISYAEIFVTDSTWPDFSRSELFDAVRAYARRTRRFGAVVDASDES
ncbi:MAG: polyprenyl diphosphate synthase [Planctomycetota bacterium]